MKRIAAIVVTVLAASAHFQAAPAKDVAACLLDRPDPLVARPAPEPEPLPEQPAAPAAASPLESAKAALDAILAPPLRLMGLRSTPVRPSPAPADRGWQSRDAG